jgi:hypothetical protein
MHHYFQVLRVRRHRYSIFGSFMHARRYIHVKFKWNRAHSPNTDVYSKVWVRSLCHQHQHLRHFYATASSCFLSPPALNMQVFPFLQPRCQNSIDLDDSIKVLIMMLPAAADAIKADAEVAIYTLLAIFIFFLHRLGVPIAVDALGCGIKFPWLHHIFSS